MAYNNIITRANAKALIPEQTIINEIIQGVVTSSSVLPLMTKLPNMSSNIAKMSVLASLPDAYWVNGDTGMKQTTNVAWKGKYIYAEELAVVVPIPEAVLNDSEYDIWAEVKPRIIEKLYKKIDEAIVLGKNKPASWRAGLLESVINVSADVAPSTDTLFTQISKAMGKVEASGYDVTGILGGVGMKAAFRTGLLDSQGQPLANSEITELPRAYAYNGAWDDTLAKFIVGDFKQAVYAIRQDIEFKLFDSGVVTDASGNIIYNLMQQDMVALRVTMRLGWELPNPVNATEDDDTVRFPFAAVQPASAPTTYNVTFTVTDSTSPTPAAVEDAFIEFAGQIKKTNSSGQAVFESLGNSSYDYVVSKGDKEVKGTTAVVATAVSVNITNF